MDWLLLGILLVGGLTAAALALLLLAPAPAAPPAEPPRDEAADSERGADDPCAPCRHGEHDEGA
jgi:hypothetical protein